MGTEASLGPEPGLLSFLYTSNARGGGPQRKKESNAGLELNDLMNELPLLFDAGEMATRTYWIYKWPSWSICQILCKPTFWKRASHALHIVSSFITYSRNFELTGSNAGDHSILRGALSSKNDK